MDMKSARIETVAPTVEDLRGVALQFSSGEVQAVPKTVAIEALVKDNILSDHGKAGYGMGFRWEAYINAGWNPEEAK